MTVRLAFAVGLALLVSACAVLPSAEKVSAFGTATETAASAIKASVGAHKTLAIRIGEEEQAANFLAGRLYTLDDAPDTTLPTEQLAVRLGAINALRDYGIALAKAADKGAITELENASAQLGLAVAAAGSAIAPLSAPIIGPATKVVFRAVGIGLGHAYAAEIQTIIQARDPDVQRLAALLADDMEKVATHLSIQQFKYSERRRLVLDRIARDPKVDRSRLYAEYKDARADVATISNLAAAAAGLPAILKAMADSHRNLAFGDGDRRQALLQFLALTDDVSVLLAAVIDGRSKT